MTNDRRRQNNGRTIGVGQRGGQPAAADGAAQLLVGGDLAAGAHAAVVGSSGWVGRSTVRLRRSLAASLRAGHDSPGRRIAVPLDIRQNRLQFCLTVLMSWDPEARERLQLVVTSLRGEGVVDLLQKVVQRVWRYNVDRHSPADIGDTSRSLGIAASENIRSLVVREGNASPRPAGLGESVRVNSADNSLLVQVAGVRLRVVKAPAAIVLVEPSWDSDFDWDDGSEVRSLAAHSNHERYVPVGVDDLFEGVLPPQGSAELLQNVFLVWAGGSDSPLTAGWLGLPTLGDRPWLAVEQLWWDQPGDADRGQRAPRHNVPNDDAFSSRSVPEPAVALKRTRQESADDQ